MTLQRKKISIFGSTGSIGRSAVEVIENNTAGFEVVTLVARSDVETLITQARKLRPQNAVIENENLLPRLKEALVDLPAISVMAGAAAIVEAAKIKCDLMISAIVGAAGMLPTLAAIEVGTNIALANKESLVCAGQFMMQAALRNNVKILPVDSEHNAIFQIFEQQNFARISDITLTASGGPFFNSDKDFKEITVVEALKHPNWVMGKKITIDSATMMNKGLEMIEAFHLFGVKQQQIKILVHPQSIIHGMVNYDDGSSLAMLSLPDMKVPISYALAYPQRMAIKHAALDLAAQKPLEFFAVDDKKFSSIAICQQALKAGGSAPIVLNAANEIAVEKFLNQQIRFDQITVIISETLARIANYQPRSIAEIVECDADARRVASSLML